MISVQKHARDNKRKDDAIKKENMRYFEFLIVYKTDIDMHKLNSK